MVDEICSDFPAQLGLSVLSVSILHRTTSTRNAVWYWEKENTVDPKTED